MYIVAIAWLFVTTLMAATEPNIVAAILTFVSYGLLPCCLLLWIIGTPQRRRNKLSSESSQTTQPDGRDPD
ncbi:MAG TPA: hypothetical protein VIE17_05330 [Methylophilaceae bacterium]|jgi:hypothetical protein